jgi:hypothetical protein
VKSFARIYRSESSFVAARLLRRDLVLKVDIHLHADQERPGIGEFHQHVCDAEVAEIA